MDNLGAIKKNSLEEKDFPLLTVSAFLDIVQAILSKIEPGKRLAIHTQVLKLANIFNFKEIDLFNFLTFR